MYKIIYKNFEDYNVDFLQNADKQSYNCDQHFKHGTIIEYIQQIMNKDTNYHINTLLEPGCGISELSAFLCKKYDTSTVYLFDFNIVNGIDVYKKQQFIFNLHKTNTTIVMKNGDFFSRIQEVPDNSVDLIIDGCSVTHFSGNDTVYNSGITSWKNASIFFKKKLKKNGYVVISSDIKNHDDILNAVDSVHEFVYPNDIINIFVNNGFKIVFDAIISNNEIEGVTPYNLKVMSICFQLSDV